MDFKVNRKTIIVLICITIVITGGLTIYLLIANMPVFQNLDPDVTIHGQGELVEFDASHTGSGTVRLVEKTDGRFSIYFINVDINPGPDLYVKLSDLASFSAPTDSPGNTLDLGKLPYVKGTFEVIIAQTINPNNFNSVIIWCAPYSVVFTYAPFN